MPQICDFIFNFSVNTFVRVTFTAFARIRFQTEVATLGIAQYTSLYFSSTMTLEDKESKSLSLKSLPYLAQYVSTCFVLSLCFEVISLLNSS